MTRIIIIIIIIVYFGKNVIKWYRPIVWLINIYIKLYAGKIMGNGYNPLHINYSVKSLFLHFQFG